MKLKWKWLKSDDFKEMSESWLMRILMVLPGFIFSYLGCYLVQGLVFGLAGPNVLTWLVCAVAAIGLPVLLAKLPKFHYLHGLSPFQQDALEWYDSLTDKERKQLPEGWDAVVRSKGDEYYGRIYLASEMLDRGREVVRLYRQNTQVSVMEDDQVQLHLELMTQRANDLRQDIDEREAVQKELTKSSLLTSPTIRRMVGRKMMEVPNPLYEGKKLQ